MAVQQADYLMAKSGNQGKVETTRDGFHRGRFEVLQPVASGHRSGLDALLIAAALPAGAKGKVADLGSGVGVAGLAALSLNENINLLSVEKDPLLAHLAGESLDLEINRNYRTRARIISADVTAPAKDRQSAGLLPESVDHVIMNPPYNPVTLRVSPDERKKSAHLMGEGGLDAWFRTAASIIKPGGSLCLIYRTEQLGDLLACVRGRFGGLEILPIHSREDEPAKRLVVRGTRGSNAPLALMPGFVIHKADNTFTDVARHVFDGEARLPLG